jgi:hypothetical protein
MSQIKDHLTMDGRGGVTGSSILHTSSVYDAKGSLLLKRLKHISAKFMFL